jgi:hypothetical protein
MAANCHKKRKNFATFILVVVVAFFGSVDANCKTHDASWDAAKGPTITQPSRVDPTKIKIDWSKIINNGR